MKAPLVGRDGILRETLSHLETTKEVHGHMQSEPEGQRADQKRTSIHEDGEKMQGMHCLSVSYKGMFRLVSIVILAPLTMEIL